MDGVKDARRPNLAAKIALAVLLLFGLAGAWCAGGFRQASRGARLETALGEHLGARWSKDRRAEGAIRVPMGATPHSDARARSFAEAIDALPEGEYRYRIRPRGADLTYEVTSPEGRAVASGFLTRELVKLRAKP